MQGRVLAAFKMSLGCSEQFADSVQGEGKGISEAQIVQFHYYYYTDFMVHNDSVLSVGISNVLADARALSFLLWSVITKQCVMTEADLNWILSHMHLINKKGCVAFL